MLISHPVFGIVSYFTADYSLKNVFSYRKCMLKFYANNNNNNNLTNFSVKTFY